jgi:tetratricopeptide (TPR) repeat protein
VTAHVDRAMLLGYIDGDPSTDRLAIAAHLAECSMCLKQLEELQARSLLARESNVLEFLEERKNDRDHPPGHFDILSTRERIRAETARAEAFFSELMRLPIEAWRETLAAAPLERTESLVGRMLHEVEVELKRRPQHALDLINIAEEITTTLEIPAMHRCAGDCWKHRANSLRHLGRFTESLDAADLAAAFYRLLPVGDFEIGQALYTRTVTLFKMTRYAEALVDLAAAAGLLRQFGDSVPLAKILILDSCILFEQGEIDRAEAAWLEVIPILERFDDRIELARVRANLAECDLKRGRNESALVQAKAAVSGFAALKMNAERIRAEWKVAAIHLAMGEHETAIELLYRAASEFRALNMAADAGFVELDIAEELLRREEWSEAARVSRSLAEVFIASGVTTASVTALSYLRTAVEGERATPALVRYVRDFVIDDDPAQTFSPPS